VKQNTSREIATVRLRLTRRRSVVASIALPLFSLRFSVLTPVRGERSANVIAFAKTSVLVTSYKSFIRSGIDQFSSVVVSFSVLHDRLLASHPPVRQYKSKLLNKKASITYEGFSNNYAVYGFISAISSRKARRRR
jgi:hypothetical protein